VLNGKLDANDVDVIYSEKKQIIKKSGLLNITRPTKLQRRAGLRQSQAVADPGASPLPRSCRPFRPFGAAGSDLLLGRAGLRQEPLRQGGGQAVEPARCCASTWARCSGMPGRLQRREHPPRHPDRGKRGPRHPSGSTEIDKALARRPPARRPTAALRRAVFGTILRWLSGKDFRGVRRLHGQPDQPPCRGTVRKGRLDRIFFVDLPARRSGPEIVRIHIKKAVARPEQVRPRGPWPAPAKASAAPRSRKRSSPRSSTPSAARRNSHRGDREEHGRNVPLSKTMSERNGPATELASGPAPRPGVHQTRRAPWKMAPARSSSDRAPINY